MAKGQGGVESKSMIDLELVKKDMLSFVQDMRGLGRGISDYRVVLCKFRLVGTLIKRRVVVGVARRIRSEKLRKLQYRKGYARSLQRKNCRMGWRKQCQTH